jgi:hypothetical protein
MEKKICYDVKIETITPITVKYRIWACSPEEAAELVQKGRATPNFISKPIIRTNTIKTLVVYLAGTVNKLLSK